MEQKEVKIIPADGWEIDRENSTFECIKFKPIEKKRFIDDENAVIKGYWISGASRICNTIDCSGTVHYDKKNYNIFATEKQAKSALAMARISQIMANDERFGGTVTDEEWENNNIYKYSIIRDGNQIVTDTFFTIYIFLAFHTTEQRYLFLEENEQLVKDYLMID